MADEETNRINELEKLYRLLAKNQDEYLCLSPQQLSRLMVAWLMVRDRDLTEILKFRTTNFEGLATEQAHKNTVANLANVGNPQKQGK